MIGVLIKMKRAQFNVEGLATVTEDLCKVIERIDFVMDDYNEDNILNVRVFNDTFDKFMDLIGKYMGKCLVTISEPYNDGLFSVSVDKSVDAGILPDVDNEFYRELKSFNKIKSAKPDDYYYTAYKFYGKNNEKIKKLYNHMVKYTNNFIKY